QFTGLIIRLRVAFRSERSLQQPLRNTRLRFHTHHHVIRHRTHRIIHVDSDWQWGWTKSRRKPGPNSQRSHGNANLNLFNSIIKRPDEYDPTKPTTLTRRHRFDNCVRCRWCIEVSSKTHPTSTNSHGHNTWNDLLWKMWNPEPHNQRVLRKVRQQTTLASQRPRSWFKFSCVCAHQHTHTHFFKRRTTASHDDDSFCRNRGLY